jgi:hypothetical protein
VRKSLGILLAMLMIIPVGVIAAPAGADAPASEGGAVAPRADVNLMDLYPQNYNTNVLYPGDSSSFYLYLVTLYAGGLFAGPNGIGNSSYLSNVTLTVDGITDLKMNILPDTPLDWALSTIQDNAGAGFTWGSPSYGYNLYADNIGNYLQFSAKVDNVRPGEYYIRIREEANVLTAYNGTPTSFQSAHIVNYDYIYIQVLSCVSPYTDYKYSLQGYTENWNGETLYAGAANQKFGLSYMYTNAGGTFTDIYADLSIADTHFRLVNRTVYLTRLYMPMVWRLDIAKGTPAGFYEVLMKLTYKRDGQLISEAWTSQSLTVAYTPLMSFPDNRGMQEPIARVRQNSPNATFTVPLRNDGNVDLKGITMRLDLDSANYFVNGNIYWNENSWTSTNYIDVTVDVGELKVGQTKDVVFSDVVLKSNLPPGKYFIPIDYMGTYYSNGSMGSSGDVVSGAWDERGYYDYSTILRAIAYPELTGTQYPGIFVLVEDDARGIELEGQISSTYSPASKNNYIQLQVLNRERYSFTDVKYLIHTDGGSPIKNQGAPDIDPSKTLPIVKRNSLGGSSSDYLYFYVDIKDIATPGVRYITVDFEGLNPYMVKATTSFDVPITIAALQPNIMSIRNSVEVGPNGIGAVSVTVKNVGMGGAKDVSVYFKPSSSNIKYVDDYIPVGNILPDNTTTYTFHVAPNTPQQSIYGTFYGYVYYQLTDDAGIQRKMFSGPSEYINFVFQPKMADLVITKVACAPISAKQTFKVTLTVSNVGGSPAENISAMVMNPNSVFNAKGTGIASLGTLGAGESKDVSFDFTAASDIPSDTPYTMTLYFSYKRADGNSLTYAEGDRESFTVRTKEVVTTTRQEQVVEYKGGSSGTQMDLGAVILGVLILVGMIFLAMTFKQRPPLPPPMQPQPPQQSFPMAPATMVHQPQQDPRNNPPPIQEPRP